MLAAPRWTMFVCLSILPQRTVRDFAVPTVRRSNSADSDPLADAFTELSLAPCLQLGTRMNPTGSALEELTVLSSRWEGSAYSF